MSVTLNFDKNFINDLKDKLHTNETETVIEAMTLLNWAVNEVSKGRVLVSVDRKTNTVVKRLAMTSLENIKVSNQ